MEMEFENQGTIITDRAAQKCVLLLTNKDDPNVVWKLTAEFKHEDEVPSKFRKVLGSTKGDTVFCKFSNTSMQSTLED